MRQRLQQRLKYKFQNLKKAPKLGLFVFLSNNSYMKKNHSKLLTISLVLIFPTFVFSAQCAERSSRFIGQELTLEFVEKLNKLSQSGDLEATILLADTNYDVYQNYPKAFSLFKVAAKRGDLYATTKLGWMYLDGKGVNRSERNAAICFTQAAGGKSFDGLRYLAHMYINGLGVEKDFVVTHALYQIAIPLGSSRNYVEIGNRNVIVRNMTSNQLSEAKELSKKLLKSNNFFITIEKYLNEHGKLGFNGKPLMAYELDLS